jgi:polyphosphate kinase 2
MAMDQSDKTARMQKRVRQDLVDSMDEELEMEIDDGRLEQFLADGIEHPKPDTLDRGIYFKELFRLQGELVKLQDWVAREKRKIVILFEGRDAAGKGGVIKRITQRLNPQVCRVAALPAPNERERTQWYFQRYVAHLPAGGEIVLFDRSWYNRAGVERVMGFCTETDVEEFFRSVPEFERMLVRSGIVLIKYWFSITDNEQQFRFLMRIHDPLKQWKLSPMDVESRRPLGAIHQGQGGDDRAHAHRGSAVVDRRGRRQEAGATELYLSLAQPDALPRDRAPACCPAATRAQSGLPSVAGSGRDVCPCGILRSNVIDDTKFVGSVTYAVRSDMMCFPYKTVGIPYKSLSAKLANALESRKLTTWHSSCSLSDKQENTAMGRNVPQGGVGDGYSPSVFVVRGCPLGRGRRAGRAGLGRRKHLRDRARPRLPRKPRRERTGRAAHHSGLARLRAEWKRCADPVHRKQHEQ